MQRATDAVDTITLTFSCGNAFLIMQSLMHFVPAKVNGSNKSALCMVMLHQRAIKHLAVMSHTVPPPPPHSVITLLTIITLCFF